MTRNDPCKKIEEQLTSYLLGDLPGKQAEEVRNHVEACERCRASLQELKPTLDILRDALAADAGAPVQLDPERRVRVREAPVRGTILEWVVQPRVLANAAAVLILCGVLGVLMMPSAMKTTGMISALGPTADEAPADMTVAQQVETKERLSETTRGWYRTAASETAHGADGGEDRFGSFAYAPIVPPPAEPPPEAAPASGRGAADANRYYSRIQGLGMDKKLAKDNEAQFEKEDFAGQYAGVKRELLGEAFVDAPGEMPVDGRAVSGGAAGYAVEGFEAWADPGVEAESIALRTTRSSSGVAGNARGGRLNDFDGDRIDVSSRRVVRTRFDADHADPSPPPPAAPMPSRPAVQEQAQVPAQIQAEAKAKVPVLGDLPTAGALWREAEPELPALETTGWVAARGRESVRGEVELGKAVERYAGAGLVDNLERDDYGPTGDMFGGFSGGTAVTDAEELGRTMDLNDYLVEVTDGNAASAFREVRAKGARAGQTTWDMQAGDFVKDIDDGSTVTVDHYAFGMPYGDAPASHSVRRKLGALEAVQSEEKHVRRGKNEALSTYGHYFEGEPALSEEVTALGTTLSRKSDSRAAGQAMDGLYDEQELEARHETVALYAQVVDEAALRQVKVVDELESTLTSLTAETLTAETLTEGLDVNELAAAVSRAIVPATADASGPAGGSREPPAAPVFRAWGVNPFVEATDNPFSTFGIDVDTAAYTLARKHLLAGYLPPPEAVRTEEFINFFDYGYRAPSRSTFAVYTDFAPAPFGEGYLLKIGVKGRRLGREEQRRANLTFVIDTSGSMDTPDRLGLIKEALRMLVEQLSPRDTVAIVQYNSQARLTLDTTAAAERDRILEGIDRLQTSGSTHLEEGILLGYEIAARNFDGAAMNRVLLLSDGMANMGSAEAEPILDRVEAFREQGIYCSVFGFGRGTYNDVMLETLANKGDGTYQFIDSHDEAKRVFVDDLAATLNVIAGDVKIQVEFDPARVQRYRQLGYENRQLKAEDFRNDAIDAGEVGSGQSVTALYEFLPAGTLHGTLGTVRVRYRRVDTGEVEEIARVITVADLSRDFEQADTRFKLAASVAEFSEILRGSPFAEGSRFEDVARVLRPVALELTLDQRVQELLRLVQAAPGMARAAE